MITEIFTRDLVQAVSDWQRGGSHDQKVKRGQRLKAVATLLPDHFRACTTTCFRQEAHEKGRVWQLLADNHLPETIASWTTDIAIAKAFKGGVPPAGQAARRDSSSISVGRSPAALRRKRASAAFRESRSSA